MIDVNVNANGEILVWNTDTIDILRSEYRIFGKLIGTVARAPHKAQLRGFPVKLSFEELTTLLSEYGDQVSIHIVRSILSTNVGPATDMILSQYASSLEDNYQGMCEHINEERIRKSNEYFEHQKSRKRKVDESLSVLPPKDGVMVHMPTYSPDSWLRSGEKMRVDMPEMKALSEVMSWLMGVWRDVLGLVVTTETLVRCAVYHRLWKEGHRVTVACKKMGGEYLLYPGDPWVCHATDVVCLMSEESEVEAAQVISTVRLVSSLKKTCLVVWYKEPSLMPVAEPAHMASLLLALRLSFNTLSYCGRTP